MNYEPDRWVYVNGEFIDRVANSVEEIERRFPGKLDRVEQGQSPWGQGTVEEVYLVTEKPCRFICLECGVPLLGAFERDGHEALTGHHRFEDRGQLCQTLS